MLLLGDLQPELPGFPSGVLICIYCTVAIQMGVYGGTAAGGFPLLHGQIKELIVPRLGRGLVLWCLLGCFSLQLPLRFGFPRLGGTLECHQCWCKVGADPRGQGGIWAAKLSVFFALCVSHGEKGWDKQPGAARGSSGGFLAFLSSCFGSRSASLGQCSFPGKVVPDPGKGF